MPSQTDHKRTRDRERESKNEQNINNSEIESKCEQLRHAQ